MKNLLLITTLVLVWATPCLAEDGEVNTNPEAIPQAISLETAANQLIKDEHNRVLGAETERVDDKSIHVIKVLTQPGRIRHFKFDAQTGQLLNN
jgi:uncharacterized membrane protein YkoI